MKKCKRALTLFLVFAMLAAFMVPVHAEDYESIRLNEPVSVTASEIFVFEPQTDGMYIFESSDYDDDPKVYVYDDQWNQILYNDDGGVGWNFRAALYASAGQTYYLEASGAGSYQVVLTRQDCQIIGADKTASVEAAPQYFAFTPATDGVYAFVSENCDQDPEGRVFDPLSDLQKSDYDSGLYGNFRVEWVAKAGKTYYLEAGGTGSYQVRVYKETVDSIADGETVSVAPEGQYFMFTPTTSCVYRFTSSDYTEYYWFEVLDDEGQRCCDFYGNEAYEANLPVKAGKTYYVYGSGDASFKLTAEKGNSINLGQTVSVEDGGLMSFTAEINGVYTISATNCDEYGSISVYDFDEEYQAGASNEGTGDFDVSLIAKAGESYYLEVSSGVAFQVTLSKKETKQLTLGQIVDVEAEEMFVFVPEQSGCYAFCSTEYIDADPKCFIYDADMNQLVYNDDGGEGWNFKGSWMAEAGKTYYLAASGYGTYQVYLQQQSLAESMILEKTLVVGDPVCRKNILLSYSCEPEGSYSGTITWSSSDESVAVVNEYGEIQIEGIGTAVITAISSIGFGASCTVVSKEAKTLPLNEAITLNGMDADIPLVFTPAEDGTYCFYSEGELDTYVDLFNEYGNIEIGNDDFNGDRNFRLYYDLVAGQTYYLYVGLVETPCDQTYQVKAGKVESATGIALSQTQITGRPGDEVELYVSAIPANGYIETVNWSSSDESVVTVYDGYVHLHGVGTAVITATTENGLSDTCTVEVVMAAGQSLSCDQTVTVPETADDQWFSFTPDTTGWYHFFTQDNGHTDPCGDLFNAYGHWLKDADDNAIDMNFDLGYYLDAGETYYLRVHFFEADGSDACTLTVKQMVQPSSITFRSNTMQGYLGGDLWIDVNIEPIDAIQELTWTSSDESIALIDPDGYVSLLDYGVVTITATTSNGLTASCEITVRKPETVKLGDVLTLSTENSQKRFWFVPEEDGWYGFYTTGEFDTYGYVYDANAEYICEDDDSGVGYNYLIRCALSAGQCYEIRSTFYESAPEIAGNYQFHVEKLVQPQKLISDYDHIRIFENGIWYLDYNFLPIASHPEYVTWTSSNPEIASVDSESGSVVGNKPGTVVMTATSDTGLTCTVEVEVVAVPEAVEFWGNCGPNLLWTMRNGVMDITGYGDMFDGYSCDHDITQVNLPEGITSIAGYFLYGRNLQTITIPAGVEKIGNRAFSYSNINRVHFLGSAPQIAENAFEGVTAEVCYPANDPTWTADVRRNYGGAITWIAKESDEPTVGTISGSFTTGADGDVTLELIGTAGTRTINVSGKTGIYSFENVSGGTYTLRVSKENHVTREYTVTVSAQTVTQDVKICLLGDVDGNGKINVGDISKLLSHIRGLNLITDEYQLLCANANGGKLNMGDISAIYAHIKGTKKL
jgi:uncharacterized protein YjdB